MKKLLTTLALVVGLLFGGVAPAGAAPEWDSKPGPRAKCVTGSEFGMIEGKTRAEAERILDGPGYAAPLWSGARDYRPCGLAWEHGRVTVHYGKAGRVWYASRMIFRGGELDLPVDHPRAH